MPKHRFPEYWKWENAPRCQTYAALCFCLTDAKLPNKPLILLYVGVGQIPNVTKPSDSFGTETRVLAFGRLYFGIETRCRRVSSMLVLGIGGSLGPAPADWLTGADRLTADCPTHQRQPSDPTDRPPITDYRVCSTRCFCIQDC